MAAEKLPHIVPSHNGALELPPKGPPKGFEKDQDEKELLVGELVDTAVAVALLLDAGDWGHDPETWQSLALGLTRALRAAADRVAVYVLESPGELASLRSTPHMIHVLEKRLGEMKESGR